MYKCIYILKTFQDFTLSIYGKGKFLSLGDSRIILFHWNQFNEILSLFS